MNGTRHTAVPSVVAAVLAGGPPHAGKRLRDALAGTALVVVADGGIALADALGLQPDLWVGDFDSSTVDQMRDHRDVPRQEHPEDKDELDLELAIDAALARGANEIVLAGVFDGRLDQTLAALFIAARLRAQGTRVRLFGGRHEAHVLLEGDELALTLPDGTLFSLISLDGEATVDVRGARFPMAAARLPFGVGLGLSNRAIGGPTVAVRSGVVALVIEWGEGPPA